jgi:acyl-CoA hydrolase
LDTQDGKPVSFSAIDNWEYIILPRDLNHSGTVFGGKIMEIADQLAGTVACRHSGNICVTLSVDHMRFWKSAYFSEILRFKIAINRVWGSSMEIGVKVCAGNPPKMEQRHIVSAYFTFVALDNAGAPTRVLPVIPETDDERRRYAEADVRRNRRLEEAKQKKGD